MMTEELLRELHQILKEDYGENLSEKELVEVADDLVRLFELLTKIQTRERLKNKNYNDTRKIHKASQ